MFPVTQAIAERAAQVVLSSADKTRFSRHLLLPEVGLSGQLQLAAARVLLVGLGGLGAPIGLYLAAAGVGTLGLADFDTVDTTNLQRQILYGEADVGRAKVDAAAQRLSQISSSLKLERHPAAITAANARAIAASYDLVIDGSDNFATRYLLSDTCVALEKPYIYGSILRFAGQAAVFYAPHGPCYRCLFPRPPAPGQVPSCAEGGVLGVLPGQIGAIQATEALKLIVGAGTPLIGRLLTLDALSMRFAEFKLAKDPDCPACGHGRSLEPPGPVLGCTRPAPGAQGGHGEASPDDLSVSEYHRWREAGVEHLLLDVRTAGEQAICVIAGSRHLPLAQLAAGVAQLPRDVPLVVYCKGGDRSRQAVAQLRQAGLTSARSLSGGILAWRVAYEPTLAHY